MFSVKMWLIVMMPWNSTSITTRIESNRLFSTLRTWHIDFVLHGPQKSSTILCRSKLNLIRGNFRNEAGIETTDHRSVDELTESEGGALLENVPVTGHTVGQNPTPGEILPAPLTAPDKEADSVLPPEGYGPDDATLSPPN